MEVGSPQGAVGEVASAAGQQSTGAAQKGDSMGVAVGTQDAVVDEPD